MTKSSALVGFALSDLSVRGPLSNRTVPLVPATSTSTLRVSIHPPSRSPASKSATRDVAGSRCAR